MKKILSFLDPRRSKLAAWALLVVGAIFILGIPRTVTHSLEDDAVRITLFGVWLGSPRYFFLAVAEVSAVLGLALFTRWLYGFTGRPWAFAVSTIISVAAYIKAIKNLDMILINTADVYIVFEDWLTTIKYLPDKFEVIGAICFGAAVAMLGWLLRKYAGSPPLPQTAHESKLNAATEVPDRNTGLHLAEVASS